MMSGHLTLPRSERLIKILCIPLLAWNLALLGLTLAYLPGLIQRISTLTLHPYHFGTLEPLTNQAVLQSAAARGMTVPGYAIYYVVFNGSLVLFYAALSGLILWKAHHQAFGWYAAAVLLFLSPYPLVEALRQSAFLPPMLIEAGSVVWPLVVLFFFVFPNGQVQPGWTRWPVGLFLAVHLTGQVFFLLTDLLPFSQEVLRLGLTLFNGAIDANFILILACQVFRFRAVSTPLERQQTKVFLVGLGLMVAAGWLEDIVGLKLFRAEVDALILVFVPLEVAISIMRYRLWDIDLIIRRTLLYTLLSGLLGLVYFGSVVILRQVLGGLTSESSAELVLSTLLIAALFNPLRRRLQTSIDRRFYRRKYDFSRSLEGFSTVIRNEVKLDALTGSLAEVVIAAIQPQTFSLWIKPQPHNPPAEPAAMGDPLSFEPGLEESPKRIV